MPPKIAVIVTAYSRDRFLPNALRSIFAQTITQSAIEVVLVTNLDAFDTLEKIQQMCGPFSTPLKILKLDSVPVGTSLAEGVKATSAEILAFLDDDDVWEPNRLELVNRFFESNARLGYFHNRQAFIFEDGQRADDTFAYQLFRHPSNLFSQRTTLVESKNIADHPRIASVTEAGFNMSSIALRRTILEPKLTLLSGLEGLQDGFCLYSAVDSGCQLLLSAQRLTHYRLHAQNASYHGLREPGERVASSLRSTEMLSQIAVFLKSSMPNSGPTNLTNLLAAEVLYFTLAASVASNDKPSRQTGSAMLRLASRPLYLLAWKNLVVWIAAFARFVAPNLIRRIRAATL